MRPCTELRQHFDDKQCQSPGTGRHRSSNNNDASRKSRIKKRLSTLLLFESYETDQLESAILDEDELQLHLMIALLEDKVFALTSNVRLIDHYRDLSCLAWVESFVWNINKEINLIFPWVQHWTWSLTDHPAQCAARVPLISRWHSSGSAGPWNFPASLESSLGPFCSAESGGILSAGIARSIQLQSGECVIIRERNN